MRMEKSVTVHILGKPYTLRVAAEDEEITREIAAYVDGKMTAFRKAFPRQDDATSAVIVALALGEELFTLREKSVSLFKDTDAELDDLSSLLESVLTSSGNGVQASEEKITKSE